MNLRSLIILFLLGHFSIFAQTITIPDPVFKAALIEADVDTNGDGEIQVSEALAQTNLDLIRSNGDPEISDLTGIESFTNLLVLDVSRHNLTSLDVTDLTSLNELRAYDNHLTSVNLSGLTNLLKLNLRYSDLTSIDVSTLLNLRHLVLGGNELSSVDLLPLEELTFFECTSCGLTSINFQNNSLLFEIAIDNNLLTVLDLSVQSNLRVLFSNDNLLTELDLTTLLALEQLELDNNFIQQLDFDNLDQLFFVNLENNLLEEIDASLSGISYLHCSSNPNLTYINVQNDVITYADPDLLYFPFLFADLPNLTTVVIDCAEFNALTYAQFDLTSVIIDGGVDCTFASDDFVDNSNIYISPNPVKHFFNIYSNVAIENYLLYTANGQQIVDSNNFELIRSTVISLKSGLYFLQVMDASGNKNVLRVLKE